MAIAPSTNGTTNGRPILFGPDGKALTLGTDRFALPHVLQYSAIYNTANRVYSWRWDEAYKNAREDALAMRRDCFLMSLLQERKLAVAQLPWHLESDEEQDANQKAVADRLTKIVQGIPFLQRMFYSLLDAVWYGRYGTQQKIGLRKVGGQQVFTVADFRPINGDKIQYRYRMAQDGPEEDDGTPALLVNAMATEQLGDGAEIVHVEQSRALLLRNPYWRDRFVIHKHYDLDDADFWDAEMAGGVHGVGVRSRIYWMWWILTEWLANISDYIQRIGTGCLIFYYEAGNPQSEQAAITAANEQSQNTVIVWPRPIGSEKQGAGVEVINPPMSGAEVLVKLREHMMGIIERFIVGQSMSGGADNESGLGGTGRANFAQDTKYRITRTDAQNLAETLTSDLIGPLQRWNCPGADFPVRFVFDIDKPNAESQIEAAKYLYEMGVALDADEVRSFAGLSKPKEGAEVIQQQQAPESPGQPGVPPVAEGQSDLQKVMAQQYAREEESLGLIERLTALADRHGHIKGQSVLRSLERLGSGPVRYAAAEVRRRLSEDRERNRDQDRQDRQHRETLAALRGQRSPVVNVSQPAITVSPAPVTVNMPQVEGEDLLVQRTVQRDDLGRIAAITDVKGHTTRRTVQRDDLGRIATVTEQKIVTNDREPGATTGGGHGDE